MDDEREYSSINKEIDANIINTVSSLQAVQVFLKERIKVLADQEDALDRRKQELDKQEARLREERLKWEKDEKVVVRANAQMSDMIKLNVGGQEFHTTRSTLCCIEGTMLSAMFSGRHTLHPDEQGRYFIDRDPRLFYYILSYLRDSKNLFLPKDKGQLKDVLNEFDYFCVPLNPTKLTFSMKKYVNIRDFPGHNAPVGCLGLIEGGQKLVSGSNDNNVKVWDVASGMCEATLSGHTGSIYALKVHGHFVYTGSHDKKIKGWDTTIGQCVANFIGHTDRVWCLQVSSDGTTLVSGGADNTIKLWDTSSHSCTMTLKGHRSWVRCVEIKDNFVFSGSDDNEIKMWDLHLQGKCVRTLKGHDESVFTLTIIGDSLISGAKDQTIRIWDFSSGECKRILYGHTRPVYCLEVVDGLIVSGSWDTSIKIWDMGTGECLQTLKGHTKAVYTVILCGDKLISGSSDNTIKVWAPESEEQ